MVVTGSFAAIAARDRDQKACALARQSGRDTGCNAWHGMAWVQVVRLQVAARHALELMQIICCASRAVCRWGGRCSNWGLRHGKAPAVEQLCEAFPTALAACSHSTSASQLI